MSEDAEFKVDDALRRELPVGPCTHLEVNSCPAPETNDYTACTNENSTAELNRGIAREAYTGDPNESLLTYRSSPTPPFQVLGVNYEFGDPTSDAASASVAVSIKDRDCIKSLLDWDQGLVAGGSPYTRIDMLDQWGRCANIVKLDNATGQNGFGRSTDYGTDSNDFIEKVVAINDNGAPCN